jgi:hypothetical protein
MKGKTIGSAEIGACLHIDNGGKASIASYTSVNKPLKVEMHDKTEKIAHKRFRMVEEEVAEIDGDKFYNKHIWNVQENVNGDVRETERSDPDHEEYGEDPAPKDGRLDRLGVLKNFTDKISDRLDGHISTSTVLFVAIGMLATAALIFAVVG